jgi:chromate transport protein ChrA
MFGLSLGVSKIGNTLPAPVYALLSGLNAATVGIIALAAVNLARKAVTDKLTRALVFLGGVAGILYTALWFFPVLMIAAGIVTVVWDFRWLHRVFVPFWRMLQAFRRPSRGASRRRRDSSIEIPPIPQCNLNAEFYQQRGTNTSTTCDCPRRTGCSRRRG